MDNQVERIEKQIAQMIMNGTPVAPILTAIAMINDDSQKFKLLDKCLDAVEKNQSLREEAERKKAELDCEQIRSAIKLHEMKMQHEIEKDNEIRKIFNNWKLITFLWSAPIFLGTAVAKLVDSIMYGIFCILCLYGVLLALYFHKETAFEKVWNIFTKNQDTNNKDSSN